MKWENAVPSNTFFYMGNGLHSKMLSLVTVFFSLEKSHFLNGKTVTAFYHFNIKLNRVKLNFPTVKKNGKNQEKRHYKIGYL